MATRERDHERRPEPTAGVTAPGPVVLATLSSRVEPEAEWLAIESAVEAGVPLLVVNAAPMPASRHALAVARRTG